MQWFRLYHEFATDPKVQCLPETFQRRYIMLLCLKCNNELPGLSDEEIACSLRISEDDAKETKQKLICKGLIDEEWNPTKWDKRQYVSDVSTARVQKFRAKQITTEPEVKNEDTDTDTDTERKALQKQKRNVSETFQCIIEYLNKRAGTKYKPTDAHKRHVDARLNEGYTIDDFKTVINKKVDEWQGTENAKYIRPETLFGTKFDGYLNQFVKESKEEEIF